MDIDLKRAKVKKWATVGLIGATGLVVSPVIFMAVGGIVGIAAAGVAGLTIVTFTPWVTMKFANWKVKAIMAEATENPIETMINLIAAKNAAFKVFKADVESAIAARTAFKQKCESFALKYPARAAEFQTQLANMSNLVEQKKTALRNAQTTLEDGEHKLEEMKAYWDMSQVAIEANKAAGMDTGDIFEKLKADTACDSVFASMNRAFAQLEVAASLDAAPVDATATPAIQLQNNEPVVIGAAVVRATEKVRQ